MESFKLQNEMINKLSVNTEEIIETCLECYRYCISCIQHCLTSGGEFAEPRHINLLIECAEVTKLTAEFMVHNSDFSHDLAEICARVCNATADSCNRLNPEDDELAKCILVCRICSDKCKQMEH